MTTTNWPGIGETPEPEPEGFRDEQIAAEAERRAAQADAAKERSGATKAELSGKGEDHSDKPAPPAARRDYGTGGPASA